jgi:hypothetical protein
MAYHAVPCRQYLYEYYGYHTPAHAAGTARAPVEMCVCEFCYRDPCGLRYGYRYLCISYGTGTGISVT